MKLPSQSALDLYVIQAFRFLGMIAIAVVYLCGTMGFVHIAKSAYYCYIQHSPHAQATTPETPKAATDSSDTIQKTDEHAATKKDLNFAPHSDPLYTAISGLEFLFMAPLAFLVLRSLGEYVEDFRQKDETAKMHHSRILEAQRVYMSTLATNGPKAAAKILEEMRQQIAGSTGSSVEFLSIGKECMLETKALTIALLFAIVSTHLIGRLIESHHSASTALVSTSEGIIGLALLAILASIYFGIEVLTSSLKLREASHGNSNHLALVSPEISDPQILGSSAPKN